MLTPEERIAQLEAEVERLMRGKAILRARTRILKQRVYELKEALAGMSYMYRWYRLYYTRELEKSRMRKPAQFALSTEKHGEIQP